MRTRADVITEITLESGTVCVDEAGYLIDTTTWTPDFARHLAAQEGIELGDLHWDVFAHMRAYFELNAIAMDQRFILKFLAKRFKTNKAGAKEKLFELFPYGYIKQAIKLAGMRQPRAWSTG